MKNAVVSKRSAVLDARIDELKKLNDWRGHALATVRA